MPLDDMLGTEEERYYGVRAPQAPTGAPATAPTSPSAGYAYNPPSGAEQALANLENATRPPRAPAVAPPRAPQVVRSALGQVGPQPQPQGPGQTAVFGPQHSETLTRAGLPSPLAAFEQYQAQKRSPVAPPAAPPIASRAQPVASPMEGMSDREQGELMRGYKGLLPGETSEQYVARRKAANMTDMGAAWTVGVKGLQQLGAGAVALGGDLVERATGYDGLREWGVETYQDLEQQMQPYQAGRITQLEQIENPWDAARFAGFSIGQMAPSLVESAGVALLGAAIGSTAPGAGTAVGAGVGLLNKTAVKGLVKSRIGKLVAQEMAAKGVAKEAAEQAVYKALAPTVGAATAMFANSYAMGLGDIYGETMDEEGRGNAAVSLIGALPYAAVDAFTDLSVFKGILRGTEGERALARVGKAMLGAGAKEGAAEAGQEAILMLAGASAGKEYGQEEVMSRLGNAFAAAAIGGGAFGAAGGVRAPKQTQAQRAEGERNAFVTLAFSDPEAMRAEGLDPAVAFAALRDPQADPGQRLQAVEAVSQTLRGRGLEDLVDGWQRVGQEAVARKQPMGPVGLQRLIERGAQQAALAAQRALQQGASQQQAQQVGDALAAQHAARVQEHADVLARIGRATGQDVLGMEADAGQAVGRTAGDQRQAEQDQEQRDADVARAGVAADGWPRSGVSGTLGRDGEGAADLGQAAVGGVAPGQARAQGRRQPMPELDAVQWADQPAEREQVPGARGQWTRELTRSRDGQWVRERALDPQGQVQRERVLSAAEVVGEIDSERASLQGMVRNWSATRPNEPWPKEWQDRLGQLETRRKQWLAPVESQADQIKGKQASAYWRSLRSGKGSKKLLGSPEFAHLRALREQGQINNVNDVRRALEQFYGGASDQVGPGDQANAAGVGGGADTLAGAEQAAGTRAAGTSAGGSGATAESTEAALDAAAAGGMGAEQPGGVTDALPQPGAEAGAGAAVGDGGAAAGSDGAAQADAGAEPAPESGMEPGMDDEAARARFDQLRATSGLPPDVFDDIKIGRAQQGQQGAHGADAAAQAQPETQQPSSAINPATDKLRNDGTPFPTDTAAKLAAKARKIAETHTPVAVDGGWVLRRQEEGQADTPAMTAARALRAEYEQLVQQQADRRRLGVFKRKLRAAAKQTPANDERATMLLDLLGTRAGIDKRLEFGPPSNAQIDQPTTGATQDAEEAQGQAPRKERGSHRSIPELVAVAAAPGRSGNQAYHAYRAVTPGEAERARREGGFSIDGYTHGVDEAAIRHALKQHGDPEVEAERGQVALTREDFARIPEITDPAQADSVDYSHKTDDGLAAVLYKKRYNGNTLIVEEVRNRRKRLAFKTMWKTRTAPRATPASDGVAHTSETPARDLPDGSNSVDQAVGDGNAVQVEQTTQEAPGRAQQTEQQAAQQQAAQQQGEQTPVVNNETAVDAPQGVLPPTGETQTDQGATEQKQPAPAAPTAEQRPADYGKNNKIFTEDAAAKARERLRKKLGQLNSGLDPEILADGITLAGYHIEAGARAFGDFAKAVIGDLGEAATPYLRSWYEGARYYPGLDTEGMTPAAEMDAAVAALDAEPAQDNAATLETEGQQEAQQNEPAATDPAGEAGQRGAGGDGVRGGRPVAAGDDQALAGEAAADGGATGTDGAPGGVRASDRYEAVPGRDGEPEGGDGVAGQPGAGQSGLATGRPGDGGRGTGGRAGGTDGAAGAGAQGATESQGAPTGDGTQENTTQDLAPSEHAQDLAARAEHFHAADPEAIYGGTPKERFRKNRRAIELYRELEETGRQPTDDERAELAGYTGWGSFGQELFQGSWDRPKYKDGWHTENDWLREHLGADEWKSAADSIINTHYTDPPTVQAIWGVVEKLGFRGGRVLEPSAGIGNFFALMPKALKDNSQLSAIEMDALSAGMLRHLYPQASIAQKPYQDSKTPDGFYDVVIGNWPFSPVGPADRRYNKLSPSLHDYFFLKALDQTRAGGLVVGITSRYTMDGVARATRMEMARKADLVAAWRLPSGAFEKYAGTKVVTDLIVFRKRETENTSPQDVSWTQTEDMALGPDGETAKINRYYHGNSDAVLGDLGWGSGTTYGRAGVIVTRPDDYARQLEQLADEVEEGLYQPSQQTKHISYIANNTDERTKAVTVGKDGELYQVQGEHLARLNDVEKWQTKNAKQTRERDAQIRALVEMRRAYGRLIDAERADADNTEALRKALKAQYQAFTQAHGPLNDSFGLGFLRKVEDPFFPSLAALERDNNGTWEPMPILDRPVMRRAVTLENPSIEDAYVLARNEGLHINMARVAERAGVTEEQAAKSLLDSGALFKAPTGEYVPADVYLSGNVRRKLREAKAAAEESAELATALERNIAELEKVIPKDVPYFNIEAKLGAQWVSPRFYRQFVSEVVLGNEAIADDLQVEWRINRWVLTAPDGLDSSPTALQWRDVVAYRESKTASGDLVLDADGKPEMVAVDSERLSLRKLVETAMNNGTMKFTGKDVDGNTFTREEISAAANERAGALREAFEDWVWKANDRKVAMERDYNEIMNAIAPPKFDGSFLRFDGMALQRGDSPFDLRKHQSDGIWRGLVQGSGLYAHEVGTGKTMTMGGIAVESRRLGLARKPLILAHNANSRAVSVEINEMYPGAKVLYVDNLAPNRVMQTLQQIRNDDWDAVVVPHSLLDRLTLKRETLEALAADEIAALEAAFWEEMNEDMTATNMNINLDDEDAIKKLRNPTAKELAKARLTIKANIDKQAQRSSREDAIAFDDLGVDMLLVDEAHLFKKPPFATRMKMRGLQKQTSNRSIALKFLTDYIKRERSGRGVHLFTGTPITNTLAEIFHQQRYVMAAEMARDGINEWDSWFNTFASGVSDVEFTAAGDYRPVTKLAGFINVAELRRMMSPYMDVVFADDMPEFKPRPTASGKTLSDTDLTEAERDELLNGRAANPQGRPYKKVIMDVAEMSPEQQVILQRQQQLAREWDSAQGKQRMEWMRSGDEHSPIIIEGVVARAGMDARMEDLNLADHEDSKINRAVRNILRHYKTEDRAAQAVFMDKGYSDHRTVRKQRVPGLNLAKELKQKLIDGGIPEQEIAIIAGGMKPERKKAIADAMNEGRVRVVIGQTETMGTGVNMQRHLRAMHHIDAPWMPGELEQRNGRGWRQGNEWNTVLEYRYITERIDGKRWQVLAVKDRFIKAFLRADEDTRVIEGDAASDDEGGYADTLSEAVGDPRLLVRQKLKQDVEKLQRKERVHAQGLVDAESRIASIEQRSKTDQATVKRYEQDAARYEQALIDAQQAQTERYQDALIGWLDGIGVNLSPAEQTAILEQGWGTKQPDRELAKRVAAAVKAAEKAGNARPEKPTTKAVQARLLNDADIQSLEELQEKLSSLLQRMPQDERRRWQVVGDLYGFPIEARESSRRGEVDLRLRSLSDPDAAISEFWGDSADGLNRSLNSLRRSAEDRARLMRRDQQELEKLKQTVDTPFARADELARKQARLEELEQDMAMNPRPAPAWLRNGAPLESEVYLRASDGELSPAVVEGHQWGEDNYYVQVDDGGTARRVPYLEVLDENGQPVFEEQVFEKPVLDDRSGQQADQAQQAKPLPKTIDVDGTQRPTTNSNGQPIHTTEVGVRNFWKWFGDSRVVDGEGRPLVVYHGTTGRRTVFRHAADVLSEQAKAQNITDKAYWGAIEAAKKEDELHFFSESEDTARTYGPDVVSAYLRVTSDASGADNFDAVDALSENESADGARIEEDSTSGGGFGGPAWVVRSSNQIKTTDNTGAFDGSNPDIRFAFGQVVNTAGSAQAAIDAVKANLGARAPTINLVQRIEELPPSLLAEARKQAGPVRAVHWRGQVYVVDRGQGRLQTERDLKHELFHAALAQGWDRGAFRSMGAGEVHQGLVSLYRALGGAEGVQRMAERYGIDLGPYRAASAQMGDQAAQALLTEELLAALNEGGPVSLGAEVRRALARVAAAIRAWLRRVGLDEIADWVGGSDARAFEVLSEAARFWSGKAPGVAVARTKGGLARVVSDRAAPSNEGAGAATQANPVFALSDASPIRQATTFDDARKAVKSFQGVPLTNSATKMVASVSRNNLDKMLSLRAVGKSETPQVHALAVANLDRLFERAILGWSKKDRQGDPNIVAVHRFFAPLRAENGWRLAKLTVKEFAREDQGNKIYSIEAVEINAKSPAASWVDSTVRDDGLDPTSTRSAGDVLTLAQAIEERNAAGDSDPRFALGSPRQAMQGIQGKVQAAREDIKATLAATGGVGKTTERTLGKGLGALTLRMLTEVASERLPSARQFEAGMQQYQTERNKMADAASQRADEITRHPHDETLALMHLMNDSTIDGIDASLDDLELLEPDVEAAQRRMAEIRKRIRTLREQVRTQRHMKDSALTRSAEQGIKEEAEALKQLQGRLKRDARRKKQHQGLHARFLALPQWARTMYEDVRDDYKRMSERMEQALYDRVVKSRLAAEEQVMERLTKARALDHETRLVLLQMLSEGMYNMEREPNGRMALEVRKDIKRALDGSGLSKRDQVEIRKRLAEGLQTKKAMIERVRLEFQAGRVEGVYFPLQRHGSYYAVLKRDRRDADTVEVDRAPDGSPMQETAFVMFDSELQMNKEKQEWEADGWTVASKGYKGQEVAQQDEVSEAFVAQVVEKLAGQGDSKQADQVFQMYLDVLPYLSARKHFIHRKKTPGYAADLARTYAFNMSHLANQIARMEAQPMLASARAGMDHQIKLAREENPDGNMIREQQFKEEFDRRYNWIMSPGGAPWASRLTGLGFLWFLGASPAAALVNLTQTPLVALPQLAGEYGFRKTGAALIKAMTETIAARRKWGARADYSAWRGLSEEDRQMLAWAHETGAIDATNVHSLMELSEGGDKQFGRAWSKTMEAVGFMFHEAEIVNREATLLAGYRLARAKGLAPAKARQSAADNMWASHGDYSNANRARWLQPNAAKVLFLFKQYSQLMAWYMGRNAWQMVKGATPEERKAASKRIGGLLGMSFVFSGTMGLPTAVTWPLFVIAEAAHTLFGDDDDEPWDAETAWRNLLADAGFAGKVIDRGAVNAVTGADVAGRVGLDQLFFRDPWADEQGGREAYQHWLSQLLGPMGSIAQNAFVAGDDLENGDVWRAAERLTPTAVRNVLQAVRWADEGVTNSQGEPIVERGDLSPWELFLKFNGMTPDEVSAQYDMNRMVKNYERRLVKDRARLLTAYWFAYLDGTPADRRKVMEKIERYNAGGPAKPIDVETLRRSVKTRMRYRGEAISGVNLDPDYRGLVERARVAM